MILPGDEKHYEALKAQNGEYTLTVCGRDGKWVWANAKIDGDTITVWSDAVKDPVKVRYAFQSNPTCNLYNKAGFPAGPFEK